MLPAILRECRSDAVSNGVGVLEALKSTRYDVIFMDCQMPEMDGFEATRLIRQRERNGVLTRSGGLPVHIIALTAGAMQGDREKCLAVGMDDYITKPMHLADMQAALDRWAALEAQMADETLQRV